MKVHNRVGYSAPEWFKEESERLAEEWVESESELDITEFILQQGSEELKEEYRKSQEAFKDSNEYQTY